MEYKKINLKPHETMNILLYSSINYIPKFLFSNWIKQFHLLPDIENASSKIPENHLISFPEYVEFFLIPNKTCKFLFSLLFRNFDASLLMYWTLRESLSFYFQIVVFCLLFESINWLVFFCSFALKWIQMNFQFPLNLWSLEKLLLLLYLRAAIICYHVSNSRLLNRTSYTDYKGLFLLCLSILFFFSPSCFASNR